MSTNSLYLSFFVKVPSIAAVLMTVDQNVLDGGQFDSGRAVLAETSKI